MNRKDSDQFDDDIFADRDEGEDETSDVIRQALAAQGVDADDQDDDAGFDQAPIEDAPGDDRVPQEEGSKLASDAQLKAETGGEGKAPKPDESKDEDAEAKAEDAADPEQTGDDAPDLTAAPMDQLLRDVPEASRAELTRRLSDAERIMAPFQSDYARGQMERFGSTPEQMSVRLMQLAEYASTKPDEYLAWAAQEMAASPDKIGEVLGNAAKLHGFKLVKAEEEGDDDIFADEETKALKRENADLKRRLEGGGPAFGPDTLQMQQQRDVQTALTSLVTERNPDGTLRRPHFRELEGHIARKAQAQRQQTQKAVTVEDIDRFYREAETEFRSMFGNPAAQPQPEVAEGDKRKAAAAERAKRASTSIDGTGQGASRRPALAADADLTDVIRHALNRSVDG
ncbi:hypothetical protein [Salipiger marinus]|uniref:Uncharacterized protein n=1 Tax=Salipiger marinus TaxID=555512 RepID=A0A1G8MRD0_9RHOB|nr:hypothetical protein [Salipiger marinus]SDI70403.1 hypothetical protein SAMN04487993_1008217 [Salipiger marinus]